MYIIHIYLQKYSLIKKTGFLYCGTREEIYNYFFLNIIDLLGRLPYIECFSKNYEILEVLLINFKRVWAAGNSLFTTFLRILGKRHINWKDWHLCTGSRLYSAVILIFVVSVSLEEYYVHQLELWNLFATFLTPNYLFLA